MRITKPFAFACLLCFSLHAEPSAFELQSGATKKDMRDLKDIADFTRSVISDFQTRIVTLEQAVDGLKTVYEGMSIAARQDSLALKQQIEKLQNLQDFASSYQILQRTYAEQMKNFKAQLDANTNNIDRINQKLDKLSEAFLQANDEILKQISVLSEQALALQNNIQGIQNQPIITSIVESNPPDTTKKYKFSTNNLENLVRAKSLFRKKQFEDSMAYFEYLIDRNFAVAESSYYIGEIYYNNKEFGEALPYYKRSASLDGKASYMPILLWHTAWSFKYLDDIGNYKKFLQTLVALFPDSEQGRKAREILSK